MKEAIKYGFILGLICFLSSTVLAVVNGITAPQIRLEKNKALNAGLKDLLSQAVDFKPRWEGNDLVYYTAYDWQGRLIGFVLKTEVKGYSSVIEALAALNTKLEITGVKVLAQNETPGLGSRITEPAFLSQFKGKTPDAFSQIQAITGATVSSSALINSLKDKISVLQPELLGKVKNAR